MLHTSAARLFATTACIVAAALLAPPAGARQRQVASTVTNFIVPQSRAFSTITPRDRAAGIRVESISAKVEIRDGAASTTLDIDVHNHSDRREESVLLIPVPVGAVVSAFDFQGGAAEPTAEVLPADEARRIYESIVAQVRDPALLEFAGLSAIRSSVFPIEPGAGQRIRITYDHIAEVDGGRIDYILPRSEALDLRRPWSVEVSIVSKRPISTVYSPSHTIDAERISAGEFRVRIQPGSVSDPGAFRLSYLVDSGAGITGTMFAYPDPSIGAGGGGYFVFMAGLPTDVAAGRALPKREVTLVIDRSGSMAGEKMDQARAAALQVIDGLADGEAFNIIAYSTGISRFSQAPVIKDAGTRRQAIEYIGTIQPRGGTNIHDALVEALAQDPADGMLPIVLFLTDGLPTIGKTSEIEIRDMVAAANPHHRRVFTFGVGADVNAPLLERIADITRARPSYVLPDQDVELAVARVFRQLHGPVVAAPTVRALDPSGAPSTRLVDELIPAIIPDMFDGDQLVLVGKYLGDGPATIELAGEFLGSPKTFSFSFDFGNATTRNAFVPRIWASRRIAFLIDEIRQAGAAPGPTVAGQSVLESPRYQELIDEIVRLSREWGILTEYTSFLAREGTDLADESALRAGCQVELETQAIRTRAGMAGVAQSLNSAERKWQDKTNLSNCYMDARGQMIEFTQVQQVNDRAFYKRGATWVDSRIATAEDHSAATVCSVGSPEYTRLLDRLIDEHRSGVISLDGDILLLIDGKAVLVTAAIPQTMTP